MNFINFIGAIGMLGFVCVIYKEREQLMTRIVYLCSDLYDRYKLINQSPDSIMNVQIIKSDDDSQGSGVEVVDVTKTYMSAPYYMDLRECDLLRILYSYKGCEYIIVLNRHNSMHFPLYTESELNESDSDEFFTSAVVINNENEYIKDVTSVLRKYAGPKADFYKGKSIPFKISYVSEMNEYIGKPYKLVFSNMMGEETIYNLELDFEI